MMIKTETKEVLYCDCCGRRSDLPLTVCPICKRENCFTCSRPLYDVWSTSICVKCLEREAIKELFMKNWQIEWSEKRAIIIKEMVDKFGQEALNVHLKS